MELALRHNRPDLETLAAVIACSQIVVAEPRRRLPTGYDGVDVAILDWIVNESRRQRRGYSRAAS